jgi:hypothetical protein
VESFTSNSVENDKQKFDFGNYFTRFFLIRPMESRMGKIACQVNTTETRWAGFLVDADAEAALPFFPKATKAKKHDDREIVAEAWEEGRTIVTSNADDFLRFISIFQNPPNNNDCRDLWGLLVIPNSQLDREKGLPSLRLGLKVPKIGLLRWPAAGFLNLYVRLTAEGQIQIQRFKRCSFCEHPERGLTIKAPWNKWYRSLPKRGAS